MIELVPRGARSTHILGVDGCRIVRTHASCWKCPPSGVDSPAVGGGIVAIAGWSGGGELAVTWPTETGRLPITGLRMDESTPSWRRTHRSG